MAQVEFDGINFGGSIKRSQTDDRARRREHTVRRGCCLTPSVPVVGAIVISANINTVFAGVSVTGEGSRG